MTIHRAVQVAVGCAASIALLVTPSSRVLRAQTAGDSAAAGVVQGVPWTGEPGIVESVSNIMARDGIAAAAPEPSLPQAVSTNFLAIQYSESGKFPPDPSGAVGPTQILVVTTGRIKVFDRNGALGPLNASTQSFFQSVLPHDFITLLRPHVVYDRLSGRFFVSMTNNDAPNYIMLAVSSGSTITSASSFTFFRFKHDEVGFFPNSDTDGLATEPTLAVDRNAVYIGVNVFGGSPFDFIGSTAFVLRKQSLLSGGPIVVTAFRQLSTLTRSGMAWPQGANSDDPGATEGYFIGTDPILFSVLILHRVGNPAGSPTLSAPIFLTVPDTALPRPVPALGSTAPLRPWDDRLMTAQMKKGSLWAVHQMSVDFSGVVTVSRDRNGARFYELTNLTAAPTLRQVGTLFELGTLQTGTARQFFNPSLAASGQGHMAIGASAAAPALSVSGPLRASVAVAGRLAFDPLGTIRPPTIAQPGGGNYNLESDVILGQSWGNYSTTVVDPNDDMTIWTFQEYCNADNSWGIQVIKLLAPTPATPTGTLPSSVTRGSTGVNVTLTGSVVDGSGFFDPGPGFASHIAAQVNGGGVTVNSVTFTDPTTIVLNISVAPSATPGARTITVTNPDGQSATSATGILTINSATPTITLKINGQHPAPPIVTTTGPVLLTLDVTPSTFTAPVSWFWALSVHNQLLWVTPAGLSTTPTPLTIAPPIAVNNATLLNYTLPAGSTVGFLFFMLDEGGSLVAFDAIAVTRP